MELADNCYECASLVNMEGGKSGYGLCLRLDNSGGPIFPVKKEQRCVFLYTQPDKKLSLEEINTRDDEEYKNFSDSEKNLKIAKQYIATWPKWKRDLLVGNFFDNIIIYSKEYQ